MLFIIASTDSLVKGRQQSEDLRIRYPGLESPDDTVARTKLGSGPCLGSTEKVRPQPAEGASATDGQNALSSFLCVDP